MESRNFVYCGSEDKWRLSDHPSRRQREPDACDANSQLHLFHRVSQHLSKGIAGTVTCCKPLIPSNQAL